MRKVGKVLASIEEVGRLFEGTELRVYQRVHMEEEIKIYVAMYTNQSNTYTQIWITVCFPCANMFGPRAVSGKELLPKELEDYIMTAKSKYLKTKHARRKIIERIKRMKGWCKEERLILVIFHTMNFLRKYGDPDKNEWFRSFTAPGIEAAHRAIDRVNKEANKKIRLSLLVREGFKALDETLLIENMNEEGTALTYTDTVINTIFQFNYCGENIDEINFAGSICIEDIGTKKHGLAIAQEMWDNYLEPMLIYFVQELRGEA